jgi:hypothetical protein
MYFCFEIHIYNTLFPQIYSNLSLYKMKWNKLFYHILLRLYSNIIYKNIVKVFQTFKVGYIQTCTSFLKIQCDITQGITIVCFHPFVAVKMFNITNNRLRPIKHIFKNKCNGADVSWFLSNPLMKDSWIFQNNKSNVNPLTRIF